MNADRKRLNAEYTTALLAWCRAVKAGVPSADLDALEARLRDMEAKLTATVLDTVLSL